MEAGEGGSRSADERQMINQELAVRYLADEMSGYPVRAPEPGNTYPCGSRV